MTAYDNAKFVVERNAYAQAKFDADATPFYRILDILNDPAAMVDVLRVLEDWKTSSATRVVFTQLDTRTYDQLTEDERKKLIDRWCMLYQTHIYDLLRRRLD